MLLIFLVFCFPHQAEKEEEYHPSTQTKSVRSPLSAEEVSAKWFLQDLLQCDKILQTTTLEWLPAQHSILQVTRPLWFPLVFCPIIEPKSIAYLYQALY